MVCAILRSYVTKQILEPGEYSHTGGDEKVRQQIQMDAVATLLVSHSYWDDQKFLCIYKAPQFINVFTKAQTMPNISYKYKYYYIQNYNFASCLYGCGTWSLTMREERRLRVFENRVLRRIFRPERDEVTGEWRKLHNEELNDLYCSPNNVRVIKSRRMRWAGHVALMLQRRGLYRV